MIQFEDNNIRPEEFDKIGMNYLIQKYGALLNNLKPQIEKSRIFQSEILENIAKKNINWEMIARHLFYAFATCDAFGQNPFDFQNIWVAYTRIRILPIVEFNKTMQSYSLSPKVVERQEFLKVALFNLAAELSGSIQLLNSEEGKRFWLAHAQMLGRIIELVYEEVNDRFNLQTLEKPEIVLKKYKTVNSPLLRSRLLETQINIISSVAAINTENINWLPFFEKLRQLLDDLSDIKEDIEIGRITYPVLVGLHREKSNGELLNIINKFWTQKLKNTKCNLNKKEWSAIKTILLKNNSIQYTCDKILKWYKKTKQALNENTLPGNVESLSLILELKKAYLYRLRKNNFDDKKPVFVIHN